MSNGNQFERLFKLQATVGKLVMDGRRDPEKIANILQAIISGSVESSFDNAPAPNNKTSLDTVIRVNRSICTVYPEGMQEVMHPELEVVGPVEYDLTQVELFLNDGQKDRKRMKGTELYEHFKETDSLKNCLGLHDAVAIQKKGIKVFRKFFGGKAVFFWKSIVRDRGGHLHVPFLYELGGEVCLYWVWLGDDWYRVHPALRFK